MNCGNVKVGDKVIVHSGGMMNYQEVREITGETPKQWIVDGHRYWKKDGSKVGYRRGFISPVEKEDHPPSEPSHDYEAQNKTIDNNHKIEYNSLCIAQAV